ncbi:MAG: double-strand break repair helicase AddA [Alphaproteobacteria bacterium]|nr:double-strand break repair helicase AddA [Alphaproteobacteria bacterium]
MSRPLPHETRPAPDPTLNQRAASDPLSSVWVNASAGSGKTKVLTDRVMRLLLTGVAPQKILCLTYTRAGAAEMANRIMDALSRWATCDDDSLEDELAELQGEAPLKESQRRARRLFALVLACPGGLRIRTLHSFCQEILSRFPIEAGLPPHFSLIEGPDLAALEDEVLNGLLRDAAASPESAFTRALQSLIAVQSEDSLSSLLKDVMHARQKILDFMEGMPQKAFDKVYACLRASPNDTPEKIRRTFVATLDDAMLRTLAAWLAEGGKKQKERRDDLLAFLALPAEARASRFEDYLRFFLTKENAPLSARSIATNDLRQAHPEIDEVCAREAERLLAVLAKIDAVSIAQTTVNMLTVGAAFARRLKKYKKARAVLDFDDLVLRTQALLQQDGINDWVRYKLDLGIDHILVDEAQDTSRAQWTIVRALTEEFFSGEGSKPGVNRTLFVVGDEKQSIFSFQNADPEAFRQFHAFFAERAGEKFKTIPLRTSFRSAPAVLTVVDAVFASTHARHGVSEEYVAHHPYPKKDGSPKQGRVELWPLVNPDKSDPLKKENWDDPTALDTPRDAQAELAEAIARRIKDWMDRRTTLPGEDRPIAPGDIMILLRKRGTFADLMVRALKRANVPVTGSDRMRLIEQLPVMDLLALVRFVLLPEDDLTLATLLRGPLIGIGEEDLMALAINRKGSLWESLRTNLAFKSLTDYLTEKRNEADFSTPFDFLSRTLNTPCPAHADSGRKALWTRLNDEAMDPLDELLNQAQAFGRRHAPSLQAFVHWLTQSNIEIKRELDRSEGLVRLLTIHASKGLEAPIVFLPDTTSVPDTKKQPKLQWTSDGVPLFLMRTPLAPAAQALWSEESARQKAEYKRLLYVALTRASHQLYIGGWKQKNANDAPETSWYRLVRDGVDGDQSWREEAPLVVADPPQAKGRPSVTPTPSKEAAPLPSWAQRPAPAAPTLRSPAPSYAADLEPTAVPDQAFVRGRIIHRLLQTLPDLPPSARPQAVARFLAQPHHALSRERQRALAREVFTLLETPDMAVIFGPRSLAEAPLTGTLDGAPAFRQIDRLCVLEDEVWVVDYKTNRPPPSAVKDVPAPYRHQLRDYRELVHGLYPDKKIRCFLLWTYAPCLMEIDPNPHTSPLPK